MSNTNAISGSSPINPVLAIPNMPAPQVISASLGQQGILTPVHPPLNLATLSNTDTSTLTDCLGSFSINTDMAPATELFSTMLPVMRGSHPIHDRGDIDTIPLNWANVALCSHMFYTPVQHIGFVVIAPEPVKGKLLVCWNPSETLDPETMRQPYYSARRRMITEEWDLAQSKTFFRTFSPNGLINQMSTESQLLPRTGDDDGAGIGPDSPFITPGYEIPSQFRNFGRLSLFIEQEIQVGSIFPKNYTILVFSCFAGTNFSVPVDFRRAAYSNERYSLITAHQNYYKMRFNTVQVVRPVRSSNRGKVSRDAKKYLLSKETHL